MRSYFARGLIAAAAAPLLLSAGACGTSGTGTDSNLGAGLTVATAMASAQPTGLAGRPGREILLGAQDALANATSVRLKGTFVEEGERISMDLRVGRKIATGTMKIPVDGEEYPAQIRYTKGRVYFRSPELIRSTAGAQAARLVGNRWFYSSKGSVTGPFQKIVDLEEFSKLFTPNAAEVPKGEVKIVNGVSAVGLVEPGEGVLYVATTGKPYPIQLAPEAGGAGGGERLDFLEYNEPFNVSVPAGAIDVDNPKF
jgi:hypothetical protein